MQTALEAHVMGGIEGTFQRRPSLFALDSLVALEG